jgi:type IV secretory pathway VirB10-like protein
MPFYPTLQHSQAKQPEWENAIDAVLETAINSDLQGMLHAVVSSDVYAETGNAVLIPKGSK